ncbi:MAG: dTDP-4-dehydrorhamnose 3,5-epimerase family protein [Candidatus Omnitrophota bacterium]|nr:dTDP-4-dehydrorhamnose 3,5-epimerase family protein [Candidatus Omnitrophota bacterium]
MKTVKTKLGGVLLIRLDPFKDFRGEYVETYNEGLYQKHGINIKFIQDDISISKHNVLRGIHGDFVTWKLISCFYGEIFFVVVNCDPKSKDFGKWQSFTLSDKNRLQVLIPPGYGNAYYVLSDKVIFSYKQSTYYNPEKQFSYKWDDPRFNILWSSTNPICSQRDA